MIDFDKIMSFELLNCLNYSLLNIIWCNSCCCFINRCYYYRCWWCSWFFWSTSFFNWTIITSWYLRFWCRFFNTTSSCWTTTFSSWWTFLWCWWCCNYCNFFWWWWTCWSSTSFLCWFINIFLFLMIWNWSWLNLWFAYSIDLFIGCTDLWWSSTFFFINITICWCYFFWLF